MVWFGHDGFVALVILARHFRIPVMEFMDLVLDGGGGGLRDRRLGCLLSGDGDYGVPTTLPWGMSFPNGIVPTMERVHPTPVYEFIAGVIIAAFLWRHGKESDKRWGIQRRNIQCAT